jgi:hypothetical protein
MFLSWTVNVFMSFEFAKGLRFHFRNAYDERASDWHRFHFAFRIGALDPANSCVDGRGFPAQRRKGLEEEPVDDSAPSAAPPKPTRLQQERVRLNAEQLGNEGK